MSSNQTSDSANASTSASQTAQSASSTTSATQGSATSATSTPILSRNQYAKQGWGSRWNFMLSYQLKPWETEDWEEGNRILDALREADAEEQMQEEKK